MTEAVAVFNDKYIKGYTVFKQSRGNVIIEIIINGLSPGYHGFHIHKSGDLRRGCDSCCSHYNPDNYPHGDIDDEESHAGDLGNIFADDQGQVIMILNTNKFKVKEIIGRSLIIHQDEDDLGRGRNKESKNTGNSGKRIACSVIGIAEEEEC